MEKKETELSKGKINTIFFSLAAIALLLFFGAQYWYYKDNSLSPWKDVFKSYLSTFMYVIIVLVTGTHLLVHGNEKKKPEQNDSLPVQKAQPQKLTVSKNLTVAKIPRMPERSTASLGKSVNQFYEEETVIPSEN